MPSTIFNSFTGYVEYHTETVIQEVPYCNSSIETVKYHTVMVIQHMSSTIPYVIQDISSNIPDISSTIL